MHAAGHERHPWKRTLKAMVSLITAGSFIMSSIAPVSSAWAVRNPAELTSVGSVRSGDPGASAPALKELDPGTFALPEYLGTVRDAWAPGEGRGPVIVHIQDAHCNYAAQHRVAEIIAYIARGYGIRTVNLEGGIKGYDLSDFERMRDNAIREKVADGFVRDGLVNGAEYLAITEPGMVSLWGIEDPELYRANLQVYRDSLRHKDEIDRALRSLTHIFSNLKRHLYGPELLQLDTKYSQYKAGNLEFRDYLSFLIDLAVSKGIDIAKLPSIDRLHRTLREEGSIDFEKANKERDALVDELQKKLSKRSREELMLATVEFQAERISQKDFYGTLMQAAKGAGIDTAAYAELAKYRSYIDLYTGIDKAAIMDEISRLETDLKKTLFKTDTERELDILSKNLILLKNLFAISLTKDDWRYYRANEAAFSIQRFVAFIGKEAPRFKIDAKPDDAVQNIDTYREALAGFYEYSLKRDEAFMKNIRFQGQSAKTAIIVTGGFHTENLCDLFKKNNISYISIMPNFRNEEGYECPYFGLLAGNFTGMEKELAAIIASSSSPAPPASAIQILTMLSQDPEADRIWGKTNIDVFRAATVIGADIAAGKKVIVTTPSGKSYIMGDETSLDKTELPLAELLNEIHQRDNDVQWENGYATGHQPVDSAGRMAAANRIAGIASRLAETHPGRADLLLKIAQQIAAGTKTRGGVDINLVQCAPDFNDLEHAGGRGIHLNATKIAAQAGTNAAARQKLIEDLIVHAAVGAVSGDHNAAEAASQGDSAKAASLLGSTESFFDTAVWNMAEGARRQVVRDYAEAATAVKPLTPDERKVSRLIADLCSPLMEKIATESRRPLADVLMESQKTIREAVPALQADLQAGGLAAFSSLIAQAAAGDAEMTNVVAYLIGARTGITTLMTPATAASFELFAKEHNLSLRDALGFIYKNDPVVTEMIDSDITMDGFAQSILAGQHAPHALLRLKSRFGPNAIRDFFRTRFASYSDYGLTKTAGTVKRAGAIRGLENPASNRRHFTSQGVTITADRALIEAAEGRETTPSLFRSNLGAYNEMLLEETQKSEMTEAVRQELIKILDMHDNLTQANFSGLLALGEAATAAATNMVDQGKIEQVINAVDDMLSQYVKIIERLQAMGIAGRTTGRGYATLNESIDFTKEAKDLKAAWAKNRASLETLLKTNRGALANLQTFGRLVSREPGTGDSPVDIATPNTVADIEPQTVGSFSLHEWISFLHQRSFMPIEKLVAHGDYVKAMTGISAHHLTRDGKPYGTAHSGLIDVGNVPAIQGSVITSEPLRAFLEARMTDQSRVGAPRIFLRDDTIVIHVQIGVHQAQINAKIADAKNGGHLRVQYMEWGTLEGNRNRLAVVLQAAKELLGMPAESATETDQTGRLLSLRYDKDTGAGTASDIARKLTLIMRLLLNTTDVNGILSRPQDRQLIDPIASYFVENGRLPSITESDADDPDAYYEMIKSPATYEHIPRLGDAATAAITRRLAELGVRGEPIPPGTRLTQRALDRFVNGPLERMIESGELIVNDKGELEQNKEYHPVDTLLNTIGRVDAAGAAISAEIGGELLARIDFETVYLVGKYVAQAGTIRTADGILSVAALRDPENGNIYFADFSLREGDRFAPVDNNRLARIVTQMTGKTPQAVTLSASELKALMAGMRQKIPAQEPGVYEFEGTRASPGKESVLAKVTLSPETAKEGGYIFMTDQTTPELMPVIGASLAVIAAKGTVTSHAGIACRQLNKPSIILSQADRIRDNGSPAYRLTVYEQGAPSRKGDFEVRKATPRTILIKENTMIFIDGKSGRIMIGEDEGALKQAVAKLSAASPAASTPATAALSSGIAAPKRAPATLPADVMMGDLRDVNAAYTDEVGGKAANLGELHRITDDSRLQAKYAAQGIDLAVPPGFFVMERAIQDIPVGTTTLYEKIKEVFNDVQIENARKEQIIRGYIENALQTPEGQELKRKLAAMREQLMSQGTLQGAANGFAVRSSGREDRQENANPGMFNTDIVVPADQVYDYVMQNFSSVATERAMAYTMQFIESGQRPADEEDGGALKHTVIVQEMIKGDVSGMIFGANPDTRNVNEVYINVSFGLNKPNVDGTVTGDTYTIDKTTGELSPRVYGSKALMLEIRDDKAGTQYYSLPDGTNTSAFTALPAKTWREWVRILAELSRDIEAHYGVPMDVEFTIKGNTIYILQARPITTLDDQAATQEARQAPEGAAPQAAAGAAGLDSYRRSFSELLAANPEVNTPDTQKLIQGATTAEEAENILKITTYFAEVMAPARELLATANDPGRPRTVFVPVSKELCGVDESFLRKEMQKDMKEGRSRLLREYQMGNLTISFFDGTIAGLDALLKQKNLDKTNAIAFLEQGKLKTADKALRDAIQQRINTAMVAVPQGEQGGLFSLPGHIALGVGLIEMGRPETSLEYKTRVFTLYQKLSPAGSKGLTRQKFLENVEAGKLVVVLPPASAIDINNNMKQFFEAQFAMMKSL